MSTAEPAKTPGVDSDRTAGGAARPPARRSRRVGAVGVAVAALVAVLGTAAASSPASAQASDAGSDEVRIVARKLSDGRIEFGLRQRQGDDSWGDTMSPRARLFPADATVERWLRSSPLTISVAATADRAATEVVVRIVARKVADGRVEFALRKQLSGNTYSGPLLPRSRFFPTTATVGRWLQSTPISVITTQPTATTTPTTSVGRAGAPAGAEAVACAGVRPPEYIPESVRAAACLPDIPGRVRFFSMITWGSQPKGPDYFLHPDPNIMEEGLLLATAMRMEAGTVFETHRYRVPDEVDPGRDTSTVPIGFRSVYKVRKVSGQLHRPEMRCTLYFPCFFKMTVTSESYSGYGPPSELISTRTRETCIPVWPAEGQGMYHFSPNSIGHSAQNC